VNGIVIDHIIAGKGIIVLNILGLPDLDHGSVVSVVMNVSAKDGRRKDIIKIEGKDLHAQELDHIHWILYVNIEGSVQSTGTFFQCTSSDLTYTLQVEQ